MSKGCVKLAIFSQAATDTASDAVIARWAQHADRAAADRRGHPAGIRRTLLGRALTRALVADLTGADPAACEITTEDSGKPSVRLPSGAAGPAVSVSHSGAVVAAAATALGALGIDVEQHRRNRPFDALAAFAFGARERAAAASPEAFYRIWSLREAMSKATGKGLREAADRTDRVPDGPAEGAWSAETPSGLWLLAHLAPLRGYSLAIAIRAGRADRAPGWSMTSIERWTPDET